MRLEADRKNKWYFTLLSKDFWPWLHNWEEFCKTAGSYRNMLWSQKIDRYGQSDRQTRGKAPATPVQPLWHAKTIISFQGVSSVAPVYTLCACSSFCFFNHSQLTEGWRQALLLSIQGFSLALIMGPKFPWKLIPVLKDTVAKEWMTVHKGKEASMPI